MANVHCHSCDWGQDDFWSWRYNIVRNILDDIKKFWWPKQLEYDEAYLKELKVKYRPILKEGLGGLAVVFSWRMLARFLKKRWYQFWGMKWWTSKSFEKEKNRVCPKCGSSALDID